MRAEQIKQDFIEYYLEEKSYPHTGVYGEDHPEDSEEIIEVGYQLFREWLQTENQKVIALIQDHIVKHANRFVNSRLKKYVGDIEIHGYYYFGICGSYYFTGVPNPAVRIPMTEAIEEILTEIERDSNIDRAYATWYRERVEKGKEFLQSCQLRLNSKDVPLTPENVYDICRFDDHKPFEGLLFRDILNWLNSGELPSVKVDGKSVVRKEDLETFFEQKRDELKGKKAMTINKKCPSCRKNYNSNDPMVSICPNCIRIHSRNHKNRN